MRVGGRRREEEDEGRGARGRGWLREGGVGWEGEGRAGKINTQDTCCRHFCIRCPTMIITSVTV